MKRLLKKSELFNGINRRNGYYEIFKNPTAKEYDIIVKEYGVNSRGVITPSGDLYLWSAEVLHDTAIELYGVPNGLHIVVYGNNSLEIYLNKDDTPETLKNTLLAGRSNLSVIGINESRELMYIDTAYYHAMRYPLYNEAKTLGDILNTELTEKTGLLKKAEIFDAFQEDGDYYEVFKNPTVKEFEEIYNSDGGIRGIINEDGTIYIWTCYILHKTLLKKINVPDGIHFEYTAGGMSIFVLPGMTLELIKTTMLNSRSKLEELGISANTHIYEFNTKYYDADRYPQYDEIDVLNDIYDLEIETQEVTAEIHDAFLYMGNYIEVFKNPTHQEIEETLKVDGDIRGLLYKDGTIYIWPSTFSHFFVKSSGLNLDYGQYHFFTEGKQWVRFHINGLKIQYDEIKNAIENAKSILSNFIDFDRTQLEIVNLVVGNKFYDNDWFYDSYSVFLELGENVQVAKQLKRLIKKADISTGFNYEGEYIEVFKNPKIEEFTEIIETSAYNDVRGVLTLEGDMYVWAGWVSHATALPRANIPDGVHFQYDSKLRIYIIAGLTLNEVTQIFEKAKSKFDSLGIGPNTVLGEFNISVYNATRYKEYESVMLLKDLYNLQTSDKTAELHDAYKHPKYDEIIEVFKNPTSSEIREITKGDSNSSIRGLLYKDGTVYAWQSDFYHEQLTKLAQDLDFNQYHFFTDGPGWMKIHSNGKGTIIYEDLKNALISAKSVFDNILNNNTKIDLTKIDLSDALYYQTNYTEIFNLTPDEEIQEKSAKKKKK